MTNLIYVVHMHMMYLINNPKQLPTAISPALTMCFLISGYFLEETYSEQKSVSDE
jgi:hypothetical protein